MKWLGEVLAYGAFAVVVGLLSVWPPYEILDPDEAVVSLTFSHPGERVGECRQLSQEELNALPPNMRKPADCPRARHPVRVELRCDDTVLYAGVLEPSGIWSDGKSNVYRRIVIPSGKHKLFVGMNHSGGRDGFDFEIVEVLDIVPGRNVVIGFDEQQQQFSIQ